MFRSLSSYKVFVSFQLGLCHVPITRLSQVSNQQASWSFAWAKLAHGKLALAAPRGGFARARALSVTRSGACALDAVQLSEALGSLRGTAVATAGRGFQKSPPRQKWNWGRSPPPVEISICGSIFPMGKTK